MTTVWSNPAADSTWISSPASILTSVAVEVVESHIRHYRDDAGELGFETAAAVTQCDGERCVRLGSGSQGHRCTAARRAHNRPSV